jgi:DNA polymerase III subunit gamma/tau
MVLVRIAYVADLPTPDEAIRMIEQNGGASPAVSASAPSRSAPAPTASAVASAPIRASAAPRAEASLRPQATAAVAEESAPARKIRSFPELVALASDRRDLLTKAALEADVRLVRFEDGRLEVALEPNASRTLINELSRKLEQWTNRRWAVIVSNEKGQATLREQNLVARKQHEQTAEADPRVQEVLARFPGAKVIEVRRLAAELPGPDISEDPDASELGPGPDDDF